MKYWSDEYPHKIWTNIMVFDNKVIDYKIGGQQREKGSWTIRWNKELVENFDKAEVLSTYEIVNNNTEHEQAFENGRLLIDRHVKNYGTYYKD